MNVSAAQLFGPRFKVRYVFFSSASAEHVRFQLISGVTMAAETISVLDSQE